jgi:phosphomannomutase
MRIGRRQEEKGMNAEGKGSIFGIDLRGDSDPRISVPPEQQVLISYGPDFFETQGLFRWVETFELGTAGYRDTINMGNLFSTDAPFNGHTIMIVAEAMGRIYERRGYKSIHLGGEVRRFTAEIIDLLGRVFAAHGIAVHLHADRATTPIWASSFGVFYNELDGGANVTASHSQSFKQGFKPMDEKGMQLLDMAGEIREEVRRIGVEAAGGGFRLRLGPRDSTLIREDFHYLQAYMEYLRMIVPGEALDLIQQAQRAGMKVGADTVGGSMHENSEPIFQHFGITTGPGGMIRYMHWEKRDDFHRVGEIGGEDYGCDPTKAIIYRNIGLKERLLAGEIHFGFIWDPDGDRYNIVTLADASMAGKAGDMGLEVEEVPGSGRCVVYFKPNQIYFLITALKLEMLAGSGDLFAYDLVIGTTYPTSKSIGELADVFNRRYAEKFKAKGTTVRVFNTAVGFKYFGNMVGEVEQKLAQGGEVFLKDATGVEVSLGRCPRILIMAEESGGAAMGSSDWTLSRNGRRRSLAMKEKDGMQLALMNLSIMAKLYLEKKSFAELYSQKIEEYDIRYRYYERIDKKLFDESLRGEAREKAQGIGNKAKEFMVDTFRSLVGREPLAAVRKELQGMVGKRVSIPEIKRVFWAGDGTYIDFGDFWFELRASGTDAVLRFYIEGKEKAFLDKMNQAFVAIADDKIRELEAEQESGARPTAQGSRNRNSRNQDRSSVP